MEDILNELGMEELYSNFMENEVLYINLIISWKFGFLSSAIVHIFWFCNSVILSTLTFFIEIYIQFNLH